MNRRIAMAVALLLIAVIAVTMTGTMAYRAGVARGLEDSGKLVAPAPGSAPYLYYGPFWHHGPFWGGPLHFVFPLLFLVLVFALFRGIFWGGGCMVRHRHGWTDADRRFEEWHRRAHESPPGSTPSA
jgi:hypothetical protein